MNEINIRILRPLVLLLNVDFDFFKEYCFFKIDHFFNNLVPVVSKKIEISNEMICDLRSLLIRFDVWDFVQFVVLEIWVIKSWRVWCNYHVNVHNEDNILLDEVNFVINQNEVNEVDVVAKMNVVKIVNNKNLNCRHNIIDVILFVVNLIPVDRIVRQVMNVNECKVV